MTEKTISDFVIKLISKECSLDIHHINVEDSFFHLGLDSINAVYLLALVEKHFDIILSPIIFWDYPTIQSFSAYIFNTYFRK